MLSAQLAVSVSEYMHINILVTYFFCHVFVSQSQSLNMMTFILLSVLFLKVGCNFVKVMHVL
jgi:hypothetical protein